MLFAKKGAALMTVLAVLVCSLLVFDASAVAADWDVVLSDVPVGALGVAPPAQSLCPECLPRRGDAARVQAPEPVQLAGLRAGPPVLLMPQVSGRNAVVTPPAPPKHHYWSRRRLAVVAVGLGLSGAGAAMWAKGKDLPNPNYSPSACQASFNSGPIPYNPNACNETLPSTGKKVGLVLMIAGGPVSLLGLLVHGL